MKHTTKLLTLLGLALGSFSAFSQDGTSATHDITITVPEVALVDLEAASGTGITLGPNAPIEAGLGLDFSAQTNSDLWINYSSIIHGTDDPSRKISATISSGSLPPGMSLTVTAGTATATGEGTKGTSAGAVILDGTNKDIITTIGSCYTGDGVSNGHNLTYNLSSSSGNYSLLDAEDATTIQITYTISDNP